MTSLHVTDLHKAFGSHAVLAGIDLTVPEGSLAAILGPSGTGVLTSAAGTSAALAGNAAGGRSLMDEAALNSPRSPCIVEAVSANRRQATFD